MELEIKIDENLKEPKILLTTPYINNNINDLIKLLKMNSYTNNNKLSLTKENTMYLIELDKIESIYASNAKVFVRTIDNQIYTSKQKLYQLEELLSSTSFIRISNSEIVNFDKVEKLDLKIIGTILLVFKSKNETYVSRRYVQKIKEYLKI